MWLAMGVWAALTVGWLWLALRADSPFARKFTLVMLVLVLLSAVFAVGYNLGFNAGLTEGSAS